MSAPVAPPETFWSTVRRIAGTRKGVGAVFATIIITVFVFALTVSYFMGKLTTESYFTRLEIAGGVLTAAWSLYITSVAYEDGNKAGAGSTAIGSVENLKIASPDTTDKKTTET